MPQEKRIQIFKGPVKFVFFGKKISVEPGLKDSLKITLPGLETVEIHDHRLGIRALYQPPYGQFFNAWMSVAEVELICFGLSGKIQIILKDPRSGMDNPRHRLVLVDRRHASFWQEKFSPKGSTPLQFIEKTIIDLETLLVGVYEA